MCAVRFMEIATAEQLVLVIGATFPSGTVATARARFIIENPSSHFGQSPKFDGLFARPQPGNMPETTPSFVSQNEKAKSQIVSQVAHAGKKP